MFQCGSCLHFRIISSFQVKSNNFLFIFWQKKNIIFFLRLRFKKTAQCAQQIKHSPLKQKRLRIAHKDKTQFLKTAKTAQCVHHIIQNTSCLHKKIFIFNSKSIQKTVTDWIFWFFRIYVQPANSKNLYKMG